MKIRPLGDRILVKRIEAFGESESGNRIAKCWRNSPIVARSALIRGSLIPRYILSMLVLCLTVPFVAAIATLRTNPLTSNAASLASGWWSPARAESATAPQLLIGMGELTRFEASGLLGMSPAQPLNHLTEPSDAAIADLPDLGSTLNARRRAAGGVGGTRFPPRTILPVAPANQVRGLGIELGGLAIAQQRAWGVSLSGFSK